MHVLMQAARIRVCAVCAECAIGSQKVVRFLCLERVLRFTEDERDDQQP